MSLKINGDSVVHRSLRITTEFFIYADFEIKTIGVDISLEHDFMLEIIHELVKIEVEYNGNFYKLKANIFSIEAVNEDWFSVLFTVRDPFSLPEGKLNMFNMVAH